MSSAAPPLDDENLLSEILLRLPPKPSSLPRASAVCKRWRRLVSDPRFLRRYRRHHRRNPPLLGCFVNDPRGISYTPTMDPPDRVPAGRFSLQLDDSGDFELINCRHGLLLMSHASRKQLLVWDPVTGEQHRIAIHEDVNPSHAAVLRAAGDVHHFQVVLVEAVNDDGQPARVFACVYSSETGVWGDLISTLIQFEAYTSGASTKFLNMPAVLVGNSLHWLLLTNNSIVILEFDFERQRLAVIQVPVDIFEMEYDFAIMRADGGGLGFLFVSEFIAKLWKREMDCDAGASWVLERTIELEKLLSWNSEKKVYRFIMGYAEENNVVFLTEVDGVVMVQLESLQFKKFTETNNAHYHHQFESVYTAGIGIGGEHDGAELVDNL